VLFLADVASAQTIVVNTSSDVTDFGGGAQSVADLPGPDGKISLAEAGLASDNTRPLKPSRPTLRTVTNVCSGSISAARF